MNILAFRRGRGTAALPQTQRGPLSGFSNGPRPYRTLALGRCSSESTSPGCYPAEALPGQDHLYRRGHERNDHVHRRDSPIRIPDAATDFVLLRGPGIGHLGSAFSDTSLNYGFWHAALVFAVGARRIPLGDSCIARYAGNTNTLSALTKAGNSKIPKTEWNPRLGN